MDGVVKLILSICEYVPSVLALIHTETEKHHKISEACQKVSEAKNIG